MFFKSKKKEKKTYSVEEKMQLVFDANVAAVKEHLKKKDKEFRFKPTDFNWFNFENATYGCPEGCDRIEIINAANKIDRKIANAIMQTAAKRTKEMFEKWIEENNMCITDYDDMHDSYYIRVADFVDKKSEETLIAVKEWTPKQS